MPPTYILTPGPGDGGSRVYLLIPCPPDQAGAVAVARPPAAAPAEGAATVGRAAIGGLTARQQEILAALGKGASNKQIARKLGIVEGTVKVQLRAIFRRLGVKNRTQAAMLAPRRPR
jgi:DNA-binding NarL/FixJ family response regulator